MKSIITILIVLFSLTTFAQDSTKTFLYQHTDTVKVATIIYGHNGNVKYTPGFVVRTGFIKSTQQGVVWEKGSLVITGYLDEKKKPIQNVFQFIEK